VKKNQLEVLKKKGAINALNFNSYGNKFAACESTTVSLWCFQDSNYGSDPFRVIKCHNKKTLNMVFLNKGSVLCVAGKSTSGSNVCICDTLLPDSKVIINEFKVLENGASILAYSDTNQILFAGGKRGSIAKIDLRQRTIMEVLPHVHENYCQSLTIDPTQRYLISGGSEGLIKVWDIKEPKMKLLKEFDVHPKTSLPRTPSSPGSKTLLRGGSYQLDFSGNNLFSCGTGGLHRFIYSYKGDDDL